MFDNLYLGFTAIALLIGQAVAGGWTIAGMALTTQTLTLIGSAILGAVLIGVSLALRPSLPKPGDGAQATQQNIPPCQYGYGRARISGPYMFYDVSNGVSFDVVALVLGKIAGFVKFYLHDDEVVPGGDGYIVSTPGFTDGRYGSGNVQILTRRGLPIETAYVEVIGNFGGTWTADHRGDGTASLMLRCKGVKDKDFQKFYPNQLPNPSAVLDFPAVWDPRDPAQEPNWDPRDPAQQDAAGRWDNYPDHDGATTYGKGARVIADGVLYISRVDANTAPVSNEEKWIYAWKNPVLQLINFLIDPVHGMGYPLSRILPVAATWMVEANLCDELVAKKDGSFEPRYTSNGWFTFETDPAEVLGAILATCDGWLTPDGDGNLSLTVGVYRPPTGPALAERHIVAMAPDFGATDEESCNELTIKFTSPLHKYREVAGQAWRDEEDISERGKTRSQNLQVSWVHSHPQARRLAKRTFARLNTPARGTMVTTLYGLAVLGRRWVRMQYPAIDGLADVIVEITGATVDFAAAKVSFNWILINPNAIDAWDSATEEGEPPPNPDDPAEDQLPVPQGLDALMVGNAISVSWDDTERNDLTYVIQYRLTDDGTGSPGPWSTQRVPEPTIEGAKIVASIPVAETKEYQVQVASVGTRGTYGDFSDSVSAGPPGPEAAAILSAFTTPASDLRAALINRFVRGLKDAGVWSALDLLYVTAAHHSQAGLVNWIDPGTNDLTAVGLPAFAVDEGYTGASGAYLDTGISPSALAKYAQSDAVIGVWSRTGVIETAGIVSASGPGVVWLIPSYREFDAVYQMNDTTGWTINGTGSVGHYTMSRSSSGSFVVYKDGASAGTINVASTGVPTGNLTLLYDGSVYSTQQIALAYAGHSLTATQVAALHDVASRYLQALGAL
ncbi:MAG: hypothetical protein WBF99_06455 [Xanthobacteraceae bacterium]